MSATVIDGKAFAARLRDRIAEHARAFEARAGRKAGLAVVLVGQDPASQVYVRSKARATLEAGMGSFEFELPAKTSQATLLDRIEQLNADPNVDGILVQLPLPGGLDELRVISTIDPDKDVDGFHVINAGRLCVGQEGFVPCTPLGCLMLLKDLLGDLSGLEAVVIGRSNIVGRPMAQLLVRENCTVTIAHSRMVKRMSCTRMESRGLGSSRRVKTNRSASTQNCLRRGSPARAPTTSMRRPPRVSSWTRARSNPCRRSSESVRAGALA